MIYTLLDFAGKELDKFTVAAEVPANEGRVVVKVKLKELLKTANSKNTFLSVQLFRNGALVDSENLYFDLIKNITLPTPIISKKIVAKGNGVEITLSTDMLAKNVYLSTEKFEGFFNTNYVDIIPGKPVVINFDGTKDADALLADLKIMSVKDTY